MTRAYVYPWLITLLVAVAVYQLSYYAEHKTPPAPAYEFYDTTTVFLHTNNIGPIPVNIFGMYYNIVEGSRKVVESRQEDQQLIAIDFHVNSPRPASIFVDEEEIEIFLLPDSNLHIYVGHQANFLHANTIQFHGATSEICNYYLSKSTTLGERGIRARRNTVTAEKFSFYSHLLDTLANRELGFLYDYHEFKNLPNYFFTFEESEILYQKAYLKLFNSLNSPQTGIFLDDVPINNVGAVFSYYYYLFLQLYFQHTFSSRSIPQELSIKDPTELDVANMQLQGEMHDVFFTRIIFQHIRREEFEIARKLLVKYNEGFSKKKYVRFLKAAISKQERS